MSNRHDLQEVAVKWKDTQDVECVCVGVGPGIDDAIDSDVMYTFTAREWNDIVKTISKGKRYDAGDFHVIKIY